MTVHRAVTGLQGHLSFHLDLVMQIDTESPCQALQVHSASMLATWRGALAPQASVHPLLLVLPPHCHSTQVRAQVLSNSQSPHKAIWGFHLHPSPPTCERPHFSEAGTRGVDATTPKLPLHLPHVSSLLQPWEHLPSFRAEELLQQRVFQIRGLGTSVLSGSPKALPPVIQKP